MGDATHHRNINQKRKLGGFVEVRTVKHINKHAWKFNNIPLSMHFDCSTSTYLNRSTSSLS